MSRNGDNPSNQNHVRLMHDDGLQVVRGVDCADKQVAPLEDSRGLSYAQLAHSKDEKEAYNVSSWDRPLHEVLGHEQRKKDRKSRTKRRKVCAIILLSTVIVIGIAVGLSIGLTRKRDQGQRFVV